LLVTHINKEAYANRYFAFLLSSNKKPLCRINPTKGQKNEKKEKIT